jgi:hypothetical protein
MSVVNWPRADARAVPETGHRSEVGSQKRHQMSADVVGGASGGAPSIEVVISSPVAHLQDPLRTIKSDRRCPRARVFETPTGGGRGIWSLEGEEYAPRQSPSVLSVLVRTQARVELDQLVDHVLSTC